MADGEITPGFDELFTGNAAHLIEVMADTAASLVSQSDFGATVEAMLDGLDRLGARASYLLVPSEDASVLVGLRRRRLPDDIAAELETLPFDSEHFVAQAARQRTPQFVSDTRRFTTGLPKLRAYLQEAPPISAVALPLLSGDDLLGVLTWSIDRPHTFQEADRHTLTALGGMFSAALAQAHGREHLKRELQRRIEAERASALYAQRFIQIIDNAPIGMAVVTLDGRFERVNAALCETVGYAKHELERLRFQDITHPDDLETDLGLARQLAAGEISRYQLEKRYIRKDGAIIHVRLHGSLVRDERGHPLHFLAQIEDVSEQVRYQSALKTSEESFRLLAENAKDIVFRVRVAPERAFEYVSPSALEITGYAPEEYYRNFDLAYTVVRPDDHERLDTYIAHLASGQPTGRVQLRGKSKTGAPLWLEFESSLVRHNGGPLIQGMVRDVTERMEMVEALQEREAELAKAQRIASVGNWRWDVATGQLHWSDEVYRIFGQEKDFTPTYEALLSCVHPDDRERLDLSVREALDMVTPYGIDHRIVRPDGSVRYVHEEARVIVGDDNSPQGMHGTVQDITDRYLAEQRLFELQQRFGSILNAASEGIYGLDLAGRTTFVNRTAADILGREPEELIGKVKHEVLHHSYPDGKPFPIEKCPLHGALRNGITQTGGHTTFWRRDGTSFPVEYSCSPTHDEQGRISGGVIVFRDISKQMQADEEREKLRARIEAERIWLRRVVERAPTGILLVEVLPGGRLVMQANPRARQLFAFPLDSTQGPGQYQGRLRSKEGRVLDAAEFPSSRALRGESVAHGEYSFLRMDGKLIPIVAAAEPVRDENGKVVGSIVVIEDITAERELERLREEWMSVIAHDLRQPLTAITMRTEILGEVCGRAGKSDVEGHLHHLKAGVSQLNRLVSDLMDLSLIEAHRMPLKKRKTDPESLLHEIVERLPVPEGRRLRLEVADHLPVVALDPARFEQIIGNLVSNAVKYGYEGTPISVRLQAAQGGVRISITNEGEGIPTEELSHLFQRFGRSARISGNISGHGLGLYIVKGLVDAHGGTIDCTSREGLETTFSIWLPPAEPPGHHPAGETPEEGAGELRGDMKSSTRKRPPS